MAGVASMTAAIEATDKYLSGVIELLPRLHDVLSVAALNEFG
jgi:hypothetical protein